VTKIQAITTMNWKIWKHQHGRRMVETYAKLWPRDVPLTVYAENFTHRMNGRIHFVDLDEAAPWLKPWKAQLTPEQCGVLRSGRYEFRHDARKFAHKVAAIHAAAQTTDAAILLWLDADTLSHSPVTVPWLEALFPAPAALAWLDRLRMFPELSFVMFRLPASRAVIDTTLALYQSGDIFKLGGQTDCHAFEFVVGNAVNRGEITVHSLSGSARRYHHVFIQTELATRLDHMKGERRKAHGRTPKWERHIRDGNPYWR
jgi:hypothetical protein